jgi:peptidylprolyl isomerase
VNSVSRRLRRLPALLLPLVLATTLVACGSDSDSSSGDDKSPAASDGTVNGVKIEGDPGKEPDVTWDGKMDAGDVETTVLTKGDGEEVAEGDQVQANLWIGNGFTQKKSYSTYDAGQPETVTASDQLSPVFKDAVLGQTIGSRIAVTATASDAFGEAGNSQLGIGNDDSVLIIVDLMDKTVVLDGPQGDEQKAPAWAPKLVEDGDQITGFDFSGAPKPDGKLKSAALVEGDGDVVKKGQSITVNYLGQVYDAKAPFDESYSKEPASFAIGAGGVIPGWDKTLVGATVGSRMILAIPPDEGYGKEGNTSAGIKGTDTLYFVVDILAAS